MVFTLKSLSASQIGALQVHVGRNFLSILILIAFVVTGCAPQPSAPAPEEVQPDAEVGLSEEMSCGEWATATSAERLEVMESAVEGPLRSAFGVEEGYLRVNRESAQIIGVDGVIADGYVDVIELVCSDQAADTSIAAAKALRMADYEYSPTCEDYSSASAEIRGIWMAVAEAKNRKTLPSVETLDTICGTLSDASIEMVTLDPELFMNRVRLAGLKWEHDNFELITRDGYSFSVSFVSEIGQPSSSVIDSPPGFAQVSFSLRTAVRYANTTKDRTNPYIGINVQIAPVWPMNSPICSAIPKNAIVLLKNSGASSDWCLPVWSPDTHLRNALQPAEKQEISSEQLYQQSFRESDVDAVKNAILEGTNTWVAFLTASSELDPTIPLSTSCQVFTHSKRVVVKYRGDLDSANCALAFS